MEYVERINGNIEDMKLYLIKHHIHALLRIITWQTMESKILILKLIIELMSYPI